MIRPQVEVNEHNDWGLGVGLQKGEEAVVWHWGVNYPGFQSLFVAWPEYNRGVVIFMNGGPMSLTFGSTRFQGLELARELVAQIMGGTHFGYWHDLN